LLIRLRYVLPVILLVLVFLPSCSGKPVNLVSVDFEKISVAFELDAGQNVARVVSYTPETDEIFYQYDPHGRDFYDALLEVIYLAYENGYLDISGEGGGVCAYAAYRAESAASAEVICEGVEYAFETFNAENGVNLIYKYEEMGALHLNGSERYAVSAGKYMLICRLAGDEDAATVIEEYRDTTMRELMKMIDNKTK